MFDFIDHLYGERLHTDRDDAKPMLDVIMTEAVAVGNRNMKPMTDEKLEQYIHKLPPEAQEDIRNNRERLLYCNINGCQEMTGYLTEIAKCIYRAADDLIAGIIARIQDHEMSEKAFKEQQSLIFMSNVRRLEAFEASYKRHRASHKDGQQKQKNNTQ